MFRKPLWIAALCLIFGLLFWSPSEALPGALLVPVVEAGSLAPHAQQSGAVGPAAAPVIIIGFVGGYVRHTDMIHSVVQVAAHLRHEYPPEVHVLVFENRHGEQAHLEILRILDATRHARPSEEEKKRARIIIYGHSWGASETLTLAGELATDGIPVLLTIQVDSVAKMGQNDGVVPANVASAVNYFQAEGLVHGRSEIRAADAEKTRILGNFRYEYKAHPLACEKYPWYDRVFMKAHTEIECDPAVWGKVESLIREEVRRPGAVPSV